MKDNFSGMTALVSLFAKAYHVQNDKPKIYDDALAARLLTQAEAEQIGKFMIGGADFFLPGEKEKLQNEEELLRKIVHTQLAPTPLMRARYAEDMLLNAVRSGAEQYVILGAGMDTSAYKNRRIPAGMQVLEADHPITQRFKIQKIREAAIKVPQNLRYVPLDFEKNDIAEELVKAGYSPRKRTFFTLLGVSYYLTKECLAKVLRSIYSVAAKGSSIVFDYADEGLFSSKTPRVQKMLALANASGEPMQTCFSYAELEKFLEDCNYLIYEQMNPEEIERLYFSYRTDDLHAFEHICLALAVVDK